MNCKRARTWLLLAETGELTPERRRRLEEHIAACAACERYAASLRALRGEYSTEAPPHTATPPPTLNAILLAARETVVQPAPKRRSVWFADWTLAERALAAAAVLLAALGLTVLLSRAPRRAAVVALDNALIERQVAAAVEAMEADWTAWEGEMALVALEFGDWYLLAGDAADEPAIAPAVFEVGI